MIVRVVTGGDDLPIRPGAGRRSARKRFTDGRRESRSPRSVDDPSLDLVITPVTSSMLGYTEALEDAGAATGWMNMMRKLTASSAQESQIPRMPKRAVSTCRAPRRRRTRRSRRSRSAPCAAPRGRACGSKRTVLRCRCAYCRCTWCWRKHGRAPCGRSAPAWRRRRTRRRLRAYRPTAAESGHGEEKPPVWAFREEDKLTPVDALHVLEAAVDCIRRRRSPA